MLSIIHILALGIAADHISVRNSDAKLMHDKHILAHQQPICIFYHSGECINAGRNIYNNWFVCRYLGAHSMTFNFKPQTVVVIK